MPSLLRCRAHAHNGCRCEKRHFHIWRKFGMHENFNERGDKIAWTEGNPWLMRQWHRWKYRNTVSIMDFMPDILREARKKRDV